jgi:hypothetical protein
MVFSKSQIVGALIFAGIVVSVMGQTTPKGCREDLPSMAVKGTQNEVMDLAQWDKTFKKRDLIILGIGDS